MILLYLRCSGILSCLLCYMFIGLVGNSAERYYRRFGFRRLYIRRSYNKFSFTWINGSPAVYTNWLFPYRYSSYFPSQKCVYIYSSTTTNIGHWDETSCSYFYARICEKEKGSFFLHFVILKEVHFMLCNTCISNNYWMRLSGILRIIEAEVCVICRSRRLRQITLTEASIIFDISRKPNSIKFAADSSSIGHYFEYRQ